MRLTTALLADAARVSRDDGKLYIHGAQWDRLFTPTLPTVHPTLSVVLVFEVPYHEALDDHALSVALLKDGQPAGPRADGTVNVGHAPRTAPGAPAYVPVCLAFNQVRFTEAGRYEWAVTIDGEPAGSLPLEVTLQPPPGPR